LRTAAPVLRNSCPAQSGRRSQSSRVDAGRDRQPQDPDATPPAFYIADRDISPNSPTTGSPPWQIRAQQTTAQLTMLCGHEP
jgi:hypothetical protein